MQIIILKDFECDAIAEHILYPDGQRSLRLELSKLDIKEPVKIKCRITSFSALDYLLCIVSALRKADFYISGLDFVYLFGMRSDRAFSAGEPNYFRDVIAPIINQLNIPMVSFFYPHSPLSASCIVNCSGIFDFANIALNKIDKIDASVVIKGDQHAFFDTDYFFSKTRNGRDITSYLPSELIPQIKKHLDKSAHAALIVDDLCDAGGTFIAAAQGFRRHFHRPLNLYIAHGLFTKGLEPLLEHFEHIYCTNSYQDIDHPRVTQFKVI